MGSYNDVLLSHIQRIREGKERFIPNPHDRMREIFNIHRGRYILLGSVTGSGKTSYVDDTLILKPYEWLNLNPFEHHFEVMYYSMERGLRDKYAKWLSWKIFQDSGRMLPSNLFSIGTYGNKIIDNEIEEIAKKYTPWMDGLLDKITVVQGPQEVERIEQDIKKTALRTCYHIHSDSTNIYINGVKKAEFNKDITKLTAKGYLPYRQVTINGTSMEILPDASVYIPKKANTFVFIVIDHIGKIKQGNLPSKKAAIDKLDEVLSNARDLYGFSPIAISQLNRAVGDTQRLKLSGGELEPILEDFKDTGNPTESADLVLSIFDAYRYRSYNAEGLYKGYCVASDTSPCTLTPSGIQRFRSLHILKNSYGASQITYGMRFTGEVMDFKLLPPVGSPELDRVYQEIILGK